MFNICSTFYQVDPKVQRRGSPRSALRPTLTPTVSS